jgi:lipopolysaccharide/colanic/teichoic acid biosynthesis glycosyltransferase
MTRQPRRERHHGLKVAVPASPLIAPGPLLAGLAPAGRAESKGPVMFRQICVGKDGREFVIVKFRRMHTDAEARLAELRHLNEVDGALYQTA